MNYSSHFYESSLMKKNNYDFDFISQKEDSDTDSDFVIKKDSTDVCYIFLQLKDGGIVRVKEDNVGLFKAYCIVNNIKYCDINSRKIKNNQNNQNIVRYKKRKCNIL